MLQGRQNEKLCQRRYSFSYITGQIVQGSSYTLKLAAFNLNTISKKAVGHHRKMNSTALRRIQACNLVIVK